MSSGELTKLTICPCTVTDGKISPDKKRTFKAKINPNNIKHNYSISYNKKKNLGQLGSDLKFSAIRPGTTTFEILLDNTGVVPKSSDVQTKIDELIRIVYKYEGDKHEPNHVQLLWGSILVYGRLTSMDVTYTLFSSAGKPLRAKVNMSFMGFMSTQEQAKRANQSSPDMTHIIEFRAGDSLPLLCHRIYQDSTRYLVVAHRNNITNFREIAPGTRIVFPPLR